MRIKLIIDGKEKTFTAPFVSSRRLKDTFALKAKFANGIDEEKMIDEAGNYLVNIYGKQFTIDELLDGFPANNFFTQAVEDMQRVMGDLDDSLKN
ncbi:phage tail assembly chaperone G [Clostridium botulinum]|uniref:phage tail assembly chaperone G n=2 Tax=Clostridium botulinum TaxID=1491 RepID=UPI0003008D6B|nr:hypothetical protein [Clostridium botulinum]KLU74194.1 hypothetical protein CBC3_p0335 [Clostridium botulinum V891]